ncbi:MAG: DUF2029 domain-containing protein [Chloroflexota bacterium]|nr:DUF2029 domain-containing protein [Chloroflexota bacterium]
MTQNGAVNRIAVVARPTGLIIASLALLWVTVATVPPMVWGADLEAYRVAGQDLRAVDNPYATSLSRFEESQYRYPPLLAMTMPLLGSSVVWYALMTLCLLGVAYLAWRDHGWGGLVLPSLVTGPLAQNFIVGNAEIAIVGLLALAPRYRRAGPIALAVATSIKLWPILGLVWFAGRRDWRGALWFFATLALLVLVQLPWMDDWIRYWQSPEAAFTVGGISLRVMFGEAIWLGITAMVAVAAILTAGSKRGWTMAVLLQLVALPRAFVPSLAVFAAAVPPRTAGLSESAVSPRSLSTS